MSGRWTDSTESGWRRWCGSVAGFLLGVILLVAAWSKAIDPVAFAEQISMEGLDLLLSAEVMAMLALALEVALGMALVLGIRRLGNLVPTLGLVVFFLFLTGRTYWRWSHGLLDDGESCGCFGNLVERTPAEAFWQDLVMLAPLALLAFLGRERGALPWKRIGVVAVLTLGAVIFAYRAPSLPLDDLATRLGRGVLVSELCAGSEDETRFCLDGLVPELEEGDHIVVIAALDDPAFLDAVDALSDFSLAAEVRLWVVTSSTLEELHSFQWQWAPAFEVREVPQALLRPLYRTLPRSFSVRDGVVAETWSDLPPLE